MRYTFLQKSAKYFTYYLGARTRYDLHSPFMYEFDTLVLPDRQISRECREIEALRKDLERLKDVLELQDLGAGSHYGNHPVKIKKISDIVRNAAVKPKYGRLLFRIVKWLQPAHVLELGTSAGIGTLYLSMGNPGTKVTTIEGSEPVAEVAKGNFNRMKVSNITSLTGNFDFVLPELLKDNTVFDLVYIDGNHTYEATVKYYNMLKGHLNNESLVIFDDIHWSEEMEQAWIEIYSDTDIIASVDLFQFGLVFFNKRLSKQHFILRY